jgi:hypothetical protein
MTRHEKINKIFEAARTGNFSDAIDDIDILSYAGENGIVNEDRFDCIDTTTIPCSIRFIGGTGYDNFSVPIDGLTDESIHTLYKCINKKK